MQKEFMQEAIDLSKENIEKQFGGPFGAVVVKDGKVVGRGFNHVVKNNDPTAHAEIQAIRDACTNLKTFGLSGCEIYISCEPCPMCLGAIFRARINKIYYGNTQKDADEIGFDDQNFYKEFSKPIDQRSIPEVQLMYDEAKKVFDEWKEKVGSVEY
ncbi:MAG TPA: nucleoside deaminase [Candidatus Absconditabacterales bacterium]|nr:nucleoside deaminase [Candidatus Absconditabacterales bacterium]HOQ78766.1 nucleoside deaminase [Candidatus Absconditabacterales bacterium]HPK27887.1 nucleoside deaminase [Candidatus Absconditabacterales bacterium]